MNQNQTSNVPSTFIASASRARSLATKLLVALAMLPLTVGCLSDEEKEARRAWAYDLSGEYTEVRDDGVEAGSLLIENESSKNDIKVTFTRGALYEGEQAFFDLIKDEGTRAELVEKIVIGAGQDELRDGLVGGENISDNFGESSKFVVASAKYEATAKLEEATDAKVYWSLSAEIQNQSDELRGSLSVFYQDKRPKNWADEEAEEGDGDERVLHTETESFPIVFKRDAGPIEGQVCDDCKSGPESEGEDEGEGEEDDEDEDESIS